MRRRGFTMLELLMVVGIIAILTGMLIPVIGVVRRSSEKKVTQATVDAVALSIRLYGWDSIQVAAGGGALRSYPSWDWNQDQVLDARPEIDVPAIVGAGHPHHALYRDGYLGFLATVKPELPRRAINGQGQVVDAWKNALRIGHAARVYGGDSVGIWSLGPNGVEDSPVGATDDLASWKRR